MVKFEKTALTAILTHDGQQQNITDFTMTFVLQAAAYDWTIRLGKVLYFNYAFCKFNE